MDTFWGLLIFFGVAVLAAGAALVLYKKLHPRTEDSERRKVSRVLRSFAAPRGCKVIDSPVLVSNGLSRLGGPHPRGLFRRSARL